MFQCTKEGSAQMFAGNKELLNIICAKAKNPSVQKNKIIHIAQYTLLRFHVGCMCLCGHKNYPCSKPTMRNPFR